MLLATSGIACSLQIDCPHVQDLRPQRAWMLQDSHVAMRSVMWHEYQKSGCALVLAIVMRPRQHDRFVLIGLCWLYGRSDLPPHPPPPTVSSEWHASNDSLGLPGSGSAGAQDHLHWHIMTEPSSWASAGCMDVVNFLLLLLLLLLNSEHGCLQDAETYWTRNKNEEGGGGYLAFSWDTAVWGADMMLTSLTDNNLVYQNEVGCAYLHDVQVGVTSKQSIGERVCVCVCICVCVEAPLRGKRERGEGGVTAVQRSMRLPTVQSYTFQADLGDRALLPLDSGCRSLLTEC